MMNNVYGMFQNFMRNPMNLLSGFGIPNNMINNPNAIIEQMMSSGRINQAQYNQAMQTYRQLQNDPRIRQILGIKG